MNTIKISFLSITLFLLFVSCNSKVRNSDNNPSISNQNNYCSIDKQNCDSIARKMGITLDEFHKWQNDVQSEIQAEDENIDQNGDIINSNSGIEICDSCGIKLFTPRNRNCSWCNNLFDGWSPGEQDCSMLVECSDKIKKEAQEQDSDAFIAKAVLGSIEIHNGCTWRVNDNEHFCSLKCMNEYKESRY